MVRLNIAGMSTQEVNRKLRELIQQDDEIIVEKGNPVERIVKVADSRNCDIIVMGSHGHGIIEEALIGSTARRVLRQATKPVLVVRLPD